MELDTGDAIYALLSMHPALLPCLAFLSRRLIPHLVADDCALPPASRLVLFSAIRVGRVNPNPNPKCRVPEFSGFDFF